jgi:polysaccharide deacetylase family protein (PEP-CTERM system associated)
VTETSADGETRVVNAMTIDVEDYFQVSAFEGIAPRHRWDSFESRVVANTERLLAIFDERGVKATFFSLGWVAERQPALVRRIASLGHEIASHGYAHRLVYDLTRDGFRDDVRRSKALLESAGEMRVHGYRAPSYSITPRSLWALDVLIEEGFSYDASVFPIHHDRYGIPLSPRCPYIVEREAGTLIEAPASAIRLGPVNLPVAGGGYFRLLPYGWTRWGIARLNDRERRPAIFYLHPWELDSQQPRLPAGVLGRIRHYRNLDQCERRLRRLLDDFRFASLATVLRQESERASNSSVAYALPYHW